MITHLVTFSDESMSRSAELCVASSELQGITTVRNWNENSLQMTLFYQANSKLLDSKRGIGYWAWKPFIILERIQELYDRFDSPTPNHVVVYADAGIEFIAPVSHVISRMDQDIFLFGNNWEHAHWCKRDTVQEIWPSRFWKPNLEYHSDKAVTWERFGKQVQASVIFFRVSDYTRGFVKEWLDWCLFEGGRLIDDSPSRLPNHPEFQEHRHDQAILTTMAYREGIRLHYWPAMYNDGAFVYEKLPCYAKDDYPILFHHHRRRNHEWSSAT